MLTTTGADEATARTALEVCNWNVEYAINMFVDQNDGQTGANIARNLSSQAPASAPVTATASQSDTQYGSQSEYLHKNHCYLRISNQSLPNRQSVRPPIPPVRQVLVEDFPSASYSNHMRRPNSGSVFDAFRDFEQEASKTLVLLL